MGTEDEQPASVGEALASWRQGDCVLGEHWFAFSQLGAGGTELAEIQVEGLVVVTQTCDIVRSSAERSYIQVSPLVHVDERRHHEIDRGRYPRYVAIPSLADRRLVADLDRTMTVHKAVVARWERHAGWTTDAEIRAIAAALARKRARFAFPDDFVELAQQLQSRLVGKHGKDSDEGRALRGLREIRIEAFPSWDAEEVRLMFWFIRNENDRLFDDVTRAAQWLDRWLRLFRQEGRYVEVQGQIATQPRCATNQMRLDRADSAELRNGDVGPPAHAALRTRWQAQREASTLPCMATRDFPVVLVSGEDGWIVAECPVIPGCISQGHTRDEALANIKEAISSASRRKQKKAGSCRVITRSWT